MVINWSNIKKAVGLTCTIIVAIGAIVGIWAFLVRPTAKLSAVIEYSEIPLPPTIVKLAYKMNELINFVSDFEKYSEDEVQEFQAVLDYQGFYRIRVTNKGDKACSGVSVKLPTVVRREYSYLVDVLREDNTHELLKDCLVVTIGDLKPQECVNVLVWSVLDASEHYAEEIRVTDDSGIASVDIRNPVGYFGRWIDKHINGIGFALFVGVLILGASFYLIGLWREQKVEAKSENNKSEGGK